MTSPATPAEARPAASEPRCSENAADLPLATPLTQLLTGQILREGETVEMVVRPSIWWVAFVSWRWVGVCAILALAGVLSFANHILERTWVEVMLVVAAGRLVWALLTWMSRLHILTTMRVLTFSGVFTTSVYECPLRKLARVRLVSSLRERLLLLGSIELIPSEDSFAIETWQTIPRPKAVHEKLTRAVQRAKEGP